jgi:nucleoside-diphosphate-sugar epimerase
MIGLNATGEGTMKIFNMYFNSWILLTTKGGKNFVYVDDAAKAIVNALYFGRTGQRYILANENLSYIEFYSKLEHCLGSQKLKIVVPDIIIKSLGIMGSLLNLFGIKAALNSANAYILTIKNFYTSSKAVQELTMPQTSIDQVLNEIVAHFTKQD